MNSISSKLTSIGLRAAIGTVLAVSELVSLSRFAILRSRLGGHTFQPSKRLDSLH